VEPTFGGVSLDRKPKFNFFGDLPVGVRGSVGIEYGEGELKRSCGNLLLFDPFPVDVETGCT
jgi:hypothetical protein